MTQKTTWENPCEAVALPKIEHKEMQTIPDKQLQALLTEAKATGVYEMYYIELATGLRRGEPLGLDSDLLITPFRKYVSPDFLKKTINPNPSPSGKTWFGLYWFGI